jgi:hypothetical protein
MRLLLFSFLCLLTLLVIRYLQRSSAARTPTGGSGQARRPPTVSEDEIVDVPFEECEKSRREGGENP